jgi:hypothetical protein
MLVRLEERARMDRAAVRVVAGDMADLDGSLPQDRPAFDVVVAAFNTFFLLPSAEAQAACLRGVAAALAPGGALVLECFVPAEPRQDVERVLEPRVVAVDHVVLTASTHDPVAQVVQGQHIELREGGTRLRPWLLRYATPAQLDEQAALAGLRLEARWAGWDRAPFDEAASMHVSVYRHG